MRRSADSLADMPGHRQPPLLLTPEGCTGITPCLQLFKGAVSCTRTYNTGARWKRVSKVLVYRFMSFDGELGRFVQSPRMATLERIKADANYVVRGSGVLVESSEIGPDGMTLPEA